MAFDLDEEEFLATRKLNGIDKEEVIDMNIGNIEEDIKILERFKNNEMQRDKLEIDNRCGGWKIGYIYKKLELNIAIEHLLLDYTRQKQINEEHQRINGELREKIKKLEEEKETLKNFTSSIFNNNIENEFVPVQKFKELEKEKEQYEQMYLDEVDKTTDIALLYNGLLNRIKNKIEEIKNDKESYYYDSFLEEKDIEKTIEVLEQLLQEEDK